jgi:hypothetical protein
MPKAVIFALILTIAASGAPGRAHHSFPVTFNTSQIAEIEGSIVALRWIEPHVEFSVLARDGSIWDIESNSIRALQRSNISAQTLSVGTEIVIAGFPARNGDHKMYSSNLLLPDGTEVVLRPGSERRWTGPGRSRR